MFKKKLLSLHFMSYLFDIDRLFSIGLLLFLVSEKPTPFKCEEKRIITPLLPAHFSLCGKSGKIIEQN